MSYQELISKINELLEDVQKYAIKLKNINYPKLMNKPDDLQLFRVQTTLGEYLHTEEPRYSDPTYWIYPKGVEEKIEDDKTYRVWYSTRDAADPADSTTWHYVKYIEEVWAGDQSINEKLLNISGLLG